MYFDALVSNGTYWRLAASFRAEAKLDGHCLFYGRSVQFQVHFKSRGNFAEGRWLMVALNIGELARQAGMQTSAIRYYESIGLMPPPPRASGWRRYDPAAIERLRVIKAARDVGFSIGEISMLLNGFPRGTPPSERWQKLAEKKLPEI